MRKILIVHSSADFYGSDRSLLEFVEHKKANLKIVVALPESGPLVNLLEQAGAEVYIGACGKVKRSMFSFIGFVNIILELVRAFAFLSQLHSRFKFDVIYSNTVAVLGGAIFAKIHRISHVWHVREIVAASPIVRSIFGILVDGFSSMVICNSFHTRKSIERGVASSRYEVIWNGFARGSVKGLDRTSERRRLGVQDDSLLFVMVGRINAWKGQRLLVEAFVRARERSGLPLRLSIVGSAIHDQKIYEEELAKCIRENACASFVEVFPERPDINGVWLASDVVVDPSLNPEPFGRVAVEAMSFSKPVIVAAHGGLVEIVKNNETGIYFEPGDVEALVSAIIELASDAPRRERLGVQGYQRWVDDFSIEAYVDRVTDVLSRV